MKKLFALLLTAAMIMAVLTGCGGKDPDPAPSNPPSDNTPANSEPAGVTANPDYPNNGTINAVVGWSAGGTTDLVARKIASLMSISLGCNNNCTNVTGASGSIAAAQVAAEGTDGETAWGGMISAINTWGVMGYNDMSWKDWYCFVSAQTDFVLVVAGDSQFNTYQEFVDYAAANPGKLSSGNPGLGSVGHLAAVTFCDAFGIETNHVPYSGGRAAAIGVMGGEIDYLFIAYGDVFDLIQSGDMKPLAIAGAGADKTVAKTDGTEVVIPCLDAEKPQIAETTSKLGMWGVALPRSVAPEQGPYTGPRLPGGAGGPAGSPDAGGNRRRRGDRQGRQECGRGIPPGGGFGPGNRPAGGGRAGRPPAPESQLRRARGL